MLALGCSVVSVVSVDAMVFMLACDGIMALESAQTKTGTSNAGLHAADPPGPALRITCC
jgi:hypothetical protein